MTLLQSLDKANLLRTNADNLYRDVVQMSPMERAEAFQELFDTMSQFATQSTAPINVAKPNEAHDLSRLAAWLMRVSLDASNFVDNQLSRASARLVVVRVTSDLSRTIRALQSRTPAQAHLVFNTTVQDCIDAFQDIRVGDIMLD